MSKPRKSSGKKTPKDLAVKDAKAVKGGKPTISDIVITQQVTKSSPVLFQQ